MCETVARRASPGLSTSSFTPVTVTVRGSSQSAAVKVRVPGFTVAAVPGALATATVTGPAGSVSSTTV